MLALLSIYTYANPMSTAEENDLVDSWHEVCEDGLLDQSNCVLVIARLAMNRTPFDWFN